MRRDAKILLGIIGGLFLLAIVFAAIAGSGTQDSNYTAPVVENTTENVPAQATTNAMSEDEYKDKVAGIVTSVADVSSEVSDDMNAYANYEITDSDMIATLETAKSTTQTSLDELNGITPPAGWENFHSKLKNALQESIYAYDDYIDGINQYDTGVLEQGTEHMKSATSYVQEANDIYNQKTG